MTDQPLSYLGTPYTNFEYGLETAFREACRLSARLAETGARIFSPICHCHPIAIYGGLDPRAHEFWMAFDGPMMRRCDNLIVAHMPGWDKSSGIAKEVEYFHHAGKPIFDLAVDTLTMVRRPASASDNWRGAMRVGVVAIDEL